MYQTTQDDEAVKAAKEKFKPVGYKLLIIMPEEVKKIGSIYIPDSAGKAEHTASMVATVIGMGDLAYKDQEKFPSGPWCKEGDDIIVRSYSGTRLKIKGVEREIRLINDDTVEAVVTGAEDIERAV